MGSRNADRVPIRAREAKGRTVAMLAHGGWDVLSTCRQCGLTMRVDLKLIAYVAGPNTSLWNRKARCRRLLCGGVVEFFAQASGMTGHEKLIYDEREMERAPGWARKRLAEVAEQRAAAGGFTRQSGAPDKRRVLRLRR